MLKGKKMTKTYLMYYHRSTGIAIEVFLETNDQEAIRVAQCWLEGYSVTSAAVFAFDRETSQMASIGSVSI